MIEQIPLSSVTPYTKNAKKHPKYQVAQIAASIKEFGFNQPIVTDSEGIIIVGHGRYEAAKTLELKTVPVMKVTLTKEQTNAYRLADNKLNESEWDMGLVYEELGELSQTMIELTGFELNLKDDGAGVSGSLSDRFIFPPFSVLNAREGKWQDRKREWLALGIKSEEGRKDDLVYGAAKGDDIVSQKIMQSGEGTSVFDPTLTEVLYQWFALPKGSILDPFAGGSVRGIVASKLGYQYTGIELRREQVDANRQQAKDLITEGSIPEWICGDSNVEIPTDRKFDFIFSCPPYADLEVYSDDPADLSNMDYTDFMMVYRSIIEKAVDQLEDNRFACFVVGEVRDKKGKYYNFVGDTISAFMDAGASYYNEIVLVTAISSLPVRAGRQFNSGRKIGKCHQNVLVFYKGNPKSIKEIYGGLDFTGIEKLSTGTPDGLAIY